MVKDRRRNLPISDEKRDELYIRSIQHSFESEFSKAKSFEHEYVRATAEINAFKKHAIADTIDYGKIEPYDALVKDKDGKWVPLYPAYSENVMFKQKRNRKSKKEIQYIDWSLPGQDYESAKFKSCGKVVYYPCDDDSGLSPVITACSHDHTHNPKVKKQCCYQLSCPRCWNDAALRRAQAAEQKILAHKFLSIKRERSVEQKIADLKDLSLNHWVVSFRTLEAKGMCRTVRGFTIIRDMVKSMMVEAGMTGGAMVFHPWGWNSKKQEWEVRPHFHILGYGWLDTKTFQDKYSPDINLIKVHEREDIRSVYLTIAYLLTHTGIARIPKLNENIDWGQRFVGQFKRFYKKKKIRGHGMFIEPDRLDDAPFSDGNDVQHRLGSYFTPEPAGFDPDEFVSQFSLEDVDIFSDGKDSFDLFPDDEELWRQFDSKYGLPSVHSSNAKETVFSDLTDSDSLDDDSEDDESRFGIDPFFNTEGGQLDGFNWKQFVLGAYTQKFMSITYFGECSTKNIRIFGVYKEKVRRTCHECRSDLNLYLYENGFLKHHEDLYYVKNSPLMCRASEYQMIQTLYLQFKTDLDDDGHTLLDFARMVPFVVTPEDMNIQPWVDDDIIEVRRQMRSEVIVRIVHPNGVTDVRMMSKRQARECGYVADGELCPSELTVSIGV